MSSWSPHKSISSISNFPNQTLSNNITGIYPLFGSKSDNDLVNIPWTTNILSSGLVRCSRILSFGRPGWTVGVPWMDDLWKIPGKVDDDRGPIGNLHCLVVDLPSEKSWSASGGMMTFPTIIPKRWGTYPDLQRTPSHCINKWENDCTNTWY